MSDLLQNLLEDGPMEVTETDQGLPEYLSILSEDHQKKAYDMSEKIDYRDLNFANSFGVTVQQKLSNFSNQLALQIQKSDTTNVSDTLDYLIEKIESINLLELSEDEEQQQISKRKGFINKVFGMDNFNSEEELILNQYQLIIKEVDELATGLNRESHVLINDLNLLDNMYVMNKDYYSAISIYVAAGKLRMSQIENEILPALQKQADLTNDPMISEEIQDLVRFQNQLEKKVHDLHVSQQISLQKAPQIRIIQENHRILIEKIQSSILNTIPLWKDQFVMYMTMQRQTQIVAIQKKVNDTTNELLKRNSELLKMNTIAIARENERRMVDMETLQITHANLISTIEEVLQLQAEGRANRRAAEKELIAMDRQLHSVMMKS